MRTLCAVANYVRARAAVLVALPVLYLVLVMAGRSEAEQTGPFVRAYIMGNAAGAGVATHAEQETQTTRLTSILAELEAHTALMDADAAGCTMDSAISTGAVLEKEIKATSGQLFYLVITNLDATNVYARLYNLTAANADENDVPIQRFLIPTGGGMVLPISIGASFSTALTLRVTTGAADTDTGVLTANEVFVSYCYQ